MEEDIKILERFINKPVRSGEFNKISNKEIKALQNLLTRYKQLEEENKKKDKRLNRQFKLLQKKDKEIEELKADNSHQWEERCRLTFELENSIPK